VHPVGGIRLVGGGPLAGQLQVKVNNRWGAVCSDTFGAEEARVVCRQVAGIGRELEACGVVGDRGWLAGLTGGWVGGSQGKWLAASSRFAASRATKANRCTTAGTCPLTLACSGTLIPCSSAATVTMPGSPAAAPACRQLGLAGGVVAPAPANFTRSAISHVSCRGTEGSLTACQYSTTISPSRADFSCSSEVPSHIKFPGPVGIRCTTGRPRSVRAGTTRAGARGWGQRAEHEAPALEGMLCHQGGPYALPPIRFPALPAV